MILDETGNSECAARYTMPHAILSSPREADWYDEVHRLSGAPIFLINGGGYFAPDGENKSPTTSSTGGLILALQRAILLLAPQGGIASISTGPL